MVKTKDYHTQHSPRSTRRPVFGLLLGAALTVAGFASSAEAQPMNYNRSLINLPASTGTFETRFDLDGDGLNDAVAIFQRRLLIFFQRSDGTFLPVPDVDLGAGAPIPDEYAAVTIGKVSDEPGSQLVLVGSAGVDYLTASQLRRRSDEPVEPSPLLDGPFSISRQPELVFLDSAFRLTGSGDEELILPRENRLEIFGPGAAGLEPIRQVALPSRSTQFSVLSSEPSLLGGAIVDDFEMRPMVRLRPRLDRWYGVRFNVTDAVEPFWVIDYDRNGLNDIVTPASIYYQQRDGTFRATPSSVHGRVETAAARLKNRLVLAPNLADLNGDGILDTFRVESTAAKFTPRTEVSIYLGRPDRTFAETPDFVLVTRDFAYNELVPIGDLDGDGTLDICLLHLDFQPASASSQLRAYLRNGLDGELRFYLWDKAANRYPDKPAFKQRITVNYDIYGVRQLFQQQISIDHDMDGDGLPDLVMKTGAQEVSIFRNLGGNRGFEQKPSAVLQSATRFSSMVVTDLNGDGHGDVLLSGYTEGDEDRIIYTCFVSGGR